MANDKKKAEDSGATPTREVKKQAVPKFVPTPDLDATSPGAGLTIKMPEGTDSNDFFKVRAEVYGIKGRNGKGPAKVREGKEVMLPCGDIAPAGATFDPIEEHLSLGRLRSLVSRKYVEVDKKVLADIVKKYKGEE